MTMKKEYLQGIDIFFATWARKNNNKNTILIFDQNKKLIYSKTIFSRKIKDNQFYPIKLMDNKYIGKGNKLYIYIYSNDADNENNITIWVDSTSTFGSLHKLILNKHDSKGLTRPLIKHLNGSMILRTYEGNNRFSLWKFFNYFFLILSLLYIYYFLSIRNKIHELRFNVKKIYFITALFFGTIFVFLTPPFQVPDEPVHFFRGYQLSDLDFFQLRQEVPKSLYKLSMISLSVREKNYHISDFQKMMKVKLAPESQIKIWSYWYIIPYVPQCIGITIGRLFDFRVLYLMYMGRVVNLLFSIFLITLAIHYIPVFKWGIFLLGLMPMTLTQLASNSYDAFTIGLALLSISYFLHLQSSNVHKVSRKNLVILFATNILLAFCRPVYCCIGFMFILIPVLKIGSKKKYIITFILLLMSMVIAPFFITLTRILIASSANPLIQIPWKPPFEQVNFICEHFITFVKIFFTTVFISHGKFYLESFVGILGWLDNPIPPLLVVSYILTLVFITIFNSKKIRTFLSTDRLILLGIFVTGFVAIEVAIYTTWSPVGYERIEGAQGRYFIPLAPLFFLAFYNGTLFYKARNLIYWIIKKFEGNSSKINLARWTLNSSLAIISTGKILIYLFSIYILSVTILVIVNKYYLF